ncbi:hypothetical protein C8R47DRAFT_537401 [Mycena vitilis]|nr:hypothetical protein C8R47DRAFT_537401 [Mycena vitilis]
MSTQGRNCRGCGSCGLGCAIFLTVCLTDPRLRSTQGNFLAIQSAPESEIILHSCARCPCGANPGAEILAIHRGCPEHSEDALFLAPMTFSETATCRGFVTSASARTLFGRGMARALQLNGLITWFIIRLPPLPESHSLDIIPGLSVPGDSWSFTRRQSVCGLRRCQLEHVRGSDGARGRSWTSLHALVLETLCPFASLLVITTGVPRVGSSRPAPVPAVDPTRGHGCGYPPIGGGLAGTRDSTVTRHHWLLDAPMSRAQSTVNNLLRSHRGLGNILRRFLKR